MGEGCLSGWSPRVSGGGREELLGSDSYVDMPRPVPRMVMTPCLPPMPRLRFPIFWQSLTFCCEFVACIPRADLPEAIDALQFYNRASKAPLPLMQICSNPMCFVYPDTVQWRCNMTPSLPYPPPTSVEPALVSASKLPPALLSLFSR